MHLVKTLSRSDNGNETAKKSIYYFSCVYLLFRETTAALVAFLILWYMFFSQHLLATYLQDFRYCHFYTTSGSVRKILAGKSKLRRGTFLKVLQTNASFSVFYKIFTKKLSQGQKKTVLVKFGYGVSYTYPTTTFD